MKVFESNLEIKKDSQKQIISGMKLLVGVVQKLSLARNLETIVEIVRHAARELTGADGASFVLKDLDQCYYVDEDAIGPLWKGRRFPMTACVSGWSMLNRKVAVIPDIYQDSRIPIDAYRETFVKSLVMVPIRPEDPIGAIGNYWGRSYQATPEEIGLLQALADSTSIAIENIQLFNDLRKSITETRNARDELARQLNLRDEFISVCTHELKTPLTPLAIQLQFLDRMVKAGEFKGSRREQDLKHGLEVSAQRVASFSSLIESLLDVSRMRLGHFTFDFEENVGLNEIIQRIVAEFNCPDSSKITTHLTGRAMGRWDSVRLEQAIRNIVSNAIKYGENKPVEVKMDVLANGFVRIVVQDHGLGIAKEEQERIFGRFERAVSHRTYGGLGLGLYIARQIIEGHSGTITVSSERGVGSSFTIELPTSRASCAQGVA